MMRRLAALSSTTKTRAVSTGMFHPTENPIHCALIIARRPRVTIIGSVGGVERDRDGVDCAAWGAKARFGLALQGGGGLYAAMVGGSAPSEVHAAATKSGTVKGKESSMAAVPTLSRASALAKSSLASARATGDGFNWRARSASSRHRLRSSFTNAIRASR